MTSAKTLTNALGGQWHGSYGAARCPAHDDRSPSLSIRDGDHDILFTCHAGCDRRDIISALAGMDIWATRERLHPETAAGTSQAAGMNRSQGRGRQLGDEVDRFTAATAAKSEAARDIWRKAETAYCSKAHGYLGARGITLDPPPSLRFVPSLKYPHSGITLPAMVAAVQSPDRTITGIHRTFLNPDGTAKANVAQPKLSLGPQGAGAIRLAYAGETLGLAEGIEDALSAMQMFDVPCWSAISAGRLARVWLPDVVRHVVIFADNGEPGVKAAHDAVEAFTAQRRKVTLRFPPGDHGDWNEVLQAASTEVA